MMPIKFALTISTVLLLASTTYAAEGKEGNGGDVVVCRDQARQVTSIELLDLYEAREIFGLTLRPIPRSARDPKVIVGLWLKDLNSVAPVRTRFYERMLETFLAESEIKEYGGLPNLPDEKDISIPENCTIEQVAIQLRPPACDPTSGKIVRPCYPDNWDAPLKNNLRYKIEKSLFEKMAPVQQAALILHEIVYRDQIIGNPHEPNLDSMTVRYVTGVLTSDQYKNIAEKSFLDTLADQNFFLLEHERFAVAGYAWDKVKDDLKKIGNFVNRFVESNVFGQWVHVTATSFDDGGKLAGVSFNQSMLVQYDGRNFNGFYHFAENNGDTTTAYFKHPIELPFLGEMIDVYGFSFHWGVTGLSNYSEFILSKPIRSKSPTHDLTLLHSAGPPCYDGSAFKCSPSALRQSYFRDVRTDRLARPFMISGHGKVLCGEKWIRVSTQRLTFNSDGRVITTLDQNGDVQPCN